MDVDEVDRRFRRSARTSSQNYKEDSEEEDESGLEEEDGFSHEDSEPEEQVSNSRTVRGRAKRRRLEDDNEALDLFNAISSSRAALKTLAHEYSNEVREDKYESYRFFTLVLKIAGYERYVSKEDVKSDDCVEMISEDFEGTSMLSDKGKETKKLMKNLESFVLFLFKEIELDSDILSHFLEWLGELSRSRKRAIRHVATVVVNYVITSFCQRCNFIEEKIVNLGEKIQNKEVVEDGNDYTSEIEEIENQIGLFYEAVFIQRYRDVDFHIRSCCISELSKWVDLKPNLFSDSNNLRYFGWFLSDPEYLVRNSCLNGVNYLMKKQERVVGFRSWIERFRNRIIEIAKEDDHELNRITAIEIIKFSYLNGMISDELIKEISLLMFDSHLKVRNSMSEFMKTIFLQEEKIVEKVCYFLLNIKDEFYELFFSQINLKDLENLESILEISKDDQNEINVSALKLLKVCCKNKDYSNILIEEMDELFSIYSGDVEKSILVCELVECITFPLNEKEEKVDGIWDDVKRCFLMNSNNSKISSVISHLMNQQNIIEKSLLKLEELKSLLIESEDEERIFNLSKKVNLELSLDDEKPFLTPRIKYVQSLWNFNKLNDDEKLNLAHLLIKASESGTFDDVIMAIEWLNLISKPQISSSFFSFFDSCFKYLRNIKSNKWTKEECEILVLSLLRSFKLDFFNVSSLKKILCYYNKFDLEIINEIMKEFLSFNVFKSIVSEIQRMQILLECISSSFEMFLESNKYEHFNDSFLLSKQIYSVMVKQTVFATDALFRFNCNGIDFVIQHLSASVDKSHKQNVLSFFKILSLFISSLTINEKSNLLKYLDSEFKKFSIKPFPPTRNNKDWDSFYNYTKLLKKNIPKRITKEKENIKENISPESVKENISPNENISPDNISSSLRENISSSNVKEFNSPKLSSQNSFNSENFIFKLENDEFQTLNSNKRTLDALSPIKPQSSSFSFQSSPKLEFQSSPTVKKVRQNLFQ